MNEILSLFPVLFLVYVLQCVSASPQGTAVFLLDFRLRGRTLRHFWLVGRSQYRLFLVNPFFPLSGAVYASGFPFSILTRPAGEICGVDFPASSAASSFDAGINFNSPRRFASRSKQLLLDDLPVAILPSERSATRLAIFLKKLQSTPAPKRRTFMNQELNRMFAIDALRERVKLFEQCTYFLSSLCFFLLVFLFLLAPGMIYMLGLSRLWPSFLITLALFSLLILWAYRRARRLLFPQRKDDLSHLLAIGLSPFAAIRAIDSLAAGLLEDFHPVAVARVLLSERSFLQFAERELRKTKFITHDVIMEQSVVAFLLAQKFDPDSLFQPPMPEDARSRTYCPACLTQYVIEQGACNDCGGVPLQPIPTMRCSPHSLTSRIES